MTTCTHCGRENEPGARFCMDCGKALSMSAMAMATPVPAAGAAASAVPATKVYASGGGAAVPGSEATCATCGKVINPALPFCAFCGAKVEAPAPAPPCPRCGTAIASGDYKFCPNCATPLGPAGAAAVAAGARPSAPHEATAVFKASRAATPPVSLQVMREDGTKSTRHGLVGEETTIGRAGADISFAEDAYLSPIHALFMWKDGRLVIRDLGSRNGTWIFLTGPHKLVDGDLILMGSQLIRFRRLGYPGPHPPEADATRRMGSLIPSADIASLAQLRADGSVRDTFHLSPGRDVALGRDRGDWAFPYDPSMSGAHAQIRSEDADFVLLDAGSRNGVAVAARGDVTLTRGSKILVGDKLMVVEVT